MTRTCFKKFVLIQNFLIFCYFCPYLLPLAAGFISQPPFAFFSLLIVLCLYFLSKCFQFFFLIPLSCSIFFIFLIGYFLTKWKEHISLKQYRNEWLIDLECFFHGFYIIFAKAISKTYNRKVVYSLSTCQFYSYLNIIFLHFFIK